MKYLASERMVSLDNTELAAAVEGPTGPLAPRALVAAAAAVGDGAALDQQSQEARTLLKEAVTSLLDPVKRIDLQIAIADESIRRYVFAPAGEDFAGIANGERCRDIGLWSSGELAFVIERALASSAPMVPSNFAATTTPGAVLAFIAIVDAFRLGHMESVVGHSYPPASVSLDDVAARVADAVAEDFRWPLCFVDKALHTPVAKVLKNKALLNAVRELADGGLINLTEAEGKAPHLIALSEFGALIADTLLHDVAKVAITVTTRAESAIETETLLMVRGARNLWLFSIAPDQGAVADLTQDSLAALVHAMLSSPAGIDPHWAPPVPEPRLAGTCSMCAADVWLVDWRCPKDHPREAVSGWYDPASGARVQPPWLVAPPPPPLSPPPPPRHT